MRDRTALINQLRGLLAEFGIIVQQGPHHLRAALPDILDDATNELPGAAPAAFHRLTEHLHRIDTLIEELTCQIEQQIADDIEAQRLLGIPGVGPLTASAAVAMVGDATAFRNGRQLAAWDGLVPRQNSSGGKT